MASNPQIVNKFLDKIQEKSIDLAKKEIKTLQEFAKDLNGVELQRWDLQYYSEKLKKKLYDLDDEIMRPYFVLDNVLRGAF